jgi:tetratricopeptide (TPR) repeat protein
MSRLPMLLYVLPFLAVSSIPAQQEPSAKAIAVSTESPSNMTPREMAELRADIYVARKMYREAIESYQRLLDAEPHNAVLFNKMGVAYQEAGESGRAGHCYKEAMKYDKNFSSAYNNLGTVEYEKRRYGKSISLYKKAMALQTDPDTLAAVYSNIGYSYFATKKYDEAMAAFQKALSLNPEVFQHHNGVGATVQQRETQDPGMLNFLLAKTYALSGNVDLCAHYLRMARDEGYKKLGSEVQSDPAFAKIIKDPKIQEVLLPPAYADSPHPRT